MRKCFGIVFLVVVSWCLLIPYGHATLPADPKLPMEYSETVMPIKETKGIPGERFEYEVSFTALFDLREVHLFISKGAGIVFDEEPKEFKGLMKKGETKSWHLKGVMKDLIKFDTGEILHPPIRLEGSYLYPYEAVRAEIIQNYKAERQSEYGPFTLEQTLQFMDSCELQGKTMKINKMWMP